MTLTRNQSAAARGVGRRTAWHLFFVVLFAVLATILLVAALGVSKFRNWPGSGFQAQSIVAQYAFAMRGDYRWATISERPSSLSPELSVLASDIGLEYQAKMPHIVFFCGDRTDGFVLLVPLVWARIQPVVLVAPIELERLDALGCSGRFEAFWADASGTPHCGTPLVPRNWVLWGWVAMYIFATPEGNSVSHAERLAQSVCARLQAEF